MLRRSLDPYFDANGQQVYTNGGFWLVGTGFVLPALAMPALAIECVLEGKPWPGCF